MKLWSLRRKSGLALFLLQIICINSGNVKSNGSNSILKGFGIFGRAITKIIESFPINGKKHSPCKVKDHPGTCMFSWECRIHGGHALGICREGFFFGACCGSPPLLSPMAPYSFLPDGQAVPVRRHNLDCGFSHVDSRKTMSRIVNGEEAEIGEFPWQVSLRLVTPMKGTLGWCGAVLLSNTWVITAAHCVKGHRPPDIVLRFGSYTIIPIGLLPFEDRRVSKVIMHPKYTSLANGFDLALVRMEKDIEFSPIISPICLPGNVGSLEKQNAVASGWGRGSESYPLFLQKAVVPILSIEECRRMYSEEGKDLKIWSNFICAGFEEGGTDSCQGDSGGPLQVLGHDNRWFLAGVTSSGYECAKPNLPGLYTRVAIHVPWILENMTS